MGKGLTSKEFDVLTVLICIGGVVAACYGAAFAVHVYRVRTDQRYRHLVDEGLHERRLLQAVREHQAIKPVTGAPPSARRRSGTPVPGSVIH